MSNNKPVASVDDQFHQVLSVNKVGVVSKEVDMCIMFPADFTQRKKRENRTGPSPEPCGVSQCCVNFRLSLKLFLFVPYKHLNQHTTCGLLQLMKTRP